MAMMRPPHPGEIIRHDVLKPLGVTISAAAKALRVTRPALSNLLNARASLTPEMALRIEKAFGPKMEHLMKMQLAYDIARTRARAASIRVRPFNRTTE
jgi:addiction module HigA family antidote